MITFFLFLIFLLALLLFRLKKYKTSGVFLAIFTIIFIMQGNGAIANFLLNKLQDPYVSSVEPSWKENNIIIILGAGTIKTADENIIKPGIFGYSRILKSAQLYFSCRKSGNSCTVMISGGDVLNIGVSEAENYRDNLITLGVHEYDIITEDKSKNTYQNAQLCAKILKEKKYDQLILVSSAMHLKRSLLYFSNFNLTPTPVMADYILAYSSFFKLTGYNFALADMALYEYEGILRFYVYNQMGWNKI